MPYNPNVISQKLNVALFMATRNRFGLLKPWIVRNYIRNRKELYKADCINVEPCYNVTYQSIAKCTENYKPTPPPCSRLWKDRTYIRTLFTDQDWYLGPTRYNPPARIDLFAGRKGSKCIRWKHKLTKPRKHTHPKYCKRYRIATEAQHSSREKGFTFSHSPRPLNEREYRLKMSNLVHYFRKLDAPDAASYYPRTHQIDYDKKEIKRKPINPHTFFLKSSVPEKDNSIHKRHSAFTPAPCQYETRYRNHSYCPKSKIYEPNLYDKIAKNKRLVYRGVLHRTIAAQKYCTPQWSHVVGHGHRYLFKTATDRPITTTPVKRKSVLIGGRDRKIAMQALPGTKYKHMINNPIRHDLSKWEKFGMPKPPMKIVYHSLKTIKKDTRRRKSRIGFASAQPRFPGEPRKSFYVFTTAFFAKRKSVAPIRDKPVTRIPIKRIACKLYDIAERRHSSLDVTKIRPQFQFSPIPEPRLLVTQSDTQGRLAFGERASPFYNKEIDICDYLENLNKCNIAMKDLNKP